MQTVNVSSTNINRKPFVTRVMEFLFAILFYLVKRYNKTNKVLNFWPRSDKDLIAHGISSQVRACISRDNRVHLRIGRWSVYIGTPQSLKRM